MQILTNLLPIPYWSGISKMTKNLNLERQAQMLVKHYFNTIQLVDLQHQKPR